MNLIEIFGQIIGLLAFAISIWGLNKTDDKAMKICVSIAFILFAIQFYLIGAYMGAFLSIIGGIRYFIASYTKNIYLMFGFVIFYIGLAIYNFENTTDLFLIFGGIIGTYSIFRLEKIPMRYAFLAGCTCNLGYHIHYIAIGSILNELLVICIHLNVIRKLRKNHKKD